MAEHIPSTTTNRKRYGHVAIESTHEAPPASNTTILDPADQGPEPSPDPERYSQMLSLTSLEPGGTRSLSKIATQAFALGIVLASGLVGTISLAIAGSALWRVPAFAACLAVFHFLEFWTTARFNPHQTLASSFLLGNGRAYDVAHAMATVEVVITRGPWWGAGKETWWSFGSGAGFVVIGFLLVLLGQVVRSAAMIHAAANFSHIPAREHRQGHVLVTSGIYAYLRHPSYFGFFFWALGTQVMVGNRICLIGYAAVLWRFFDRRIDAEERSLVEFFGQDYTDYRQRVGTGIPFIK